jgi:GH25 family lysozyme M1 (1,4-beta-N-acetylmuramidase)
MKLPDELEKSSDRGRSLPLMYAIGGVSLMVLLILVIVIVSNNPANNRNNGSQGVGATASPSGAAGGDETDVANTPSGSSGLSPEDLDFWNRYPQDEEGLNNQDVDPEDPVEESPSPDPSPDPSEDGRHTLVERRDGSSEWIRLNPYLARNIYDPLAFIMKNDRMGYYEQERMVSKFGIDLSAQNGRVEFARVKNAGVDFVMLRLGARGYETGHITIDERFHEYLNDALANGLQVGVYFFSQAISREEAAEEATLVIEALAERRITYPVVFQMDYIAYGSSRIDGLTRAQKTDIAETFCNYMEGAGYVPMIYGNKEWLLEQIDLTRLTNFDIWLSQAKPLPDYPYTFQMWQYSFSGSMAGISGEVNMNISFMDYTAR